MTCFFSLIFRFCFATSCGCGIFTASGSSGPGVAGGSVRGDAEKDRQGRESRQATRDVQAREDALV